MIPLWRILPKNTPKVFSVALFLAVISVGCIKSHLQLSHSSVPVVAIRDAPMYAMKVEGVRREVMHHMELSTYFKIAYCAPSLT